MIVDIFAHHISESVGKILPRKKYYSDNSDDHKEFTYPKQNSDPELRLSLMEKYGVDVQALSQTTPVLLGFNAADAAEICRKSNDDNFKLCKAYPDKFVNICMFSLLDVEDAIQELDRSVAELDCRAVTIATNQNGKGLDSKDFLPFYDKVAEYDLPVFLQPTHFDSYPLVEMDKGWQMMLVFGWPFDTTQAVWRLIFGGVLDRYPTLKIVTHHCGAMLPFFVKRAESIFRGALSKELPRPINEYWKNLFGDTVLGGTVSALMCGYEFFGPDRMMYGSDYPFGGEEGESSIRENLVSIKEMAIPEEDIRKIQGANARQLLRIS